MRIIKILAIDSCSQVATCALLVDDVLLCEFVLNDKKTHSIKLLPQIQQMLLVSGLDICDIDYFACTVGPGSFTGQRIDVATVKGLSHATNKPTVSVSSLEAMAYNLTHTPFLICPIMDARRQQVYTATFKWEGDGLVRIENDRLVALCDLLDELQNKDVIFLGDGVPVFKQKIIDTLGKTAHFAPDHLIHIRGGSVAYCAKKYISLGEICDYNTLQPTYLRLCQAERELKERITL